jgi:hypothetical protein
MSSILDGLTVGGDDGAATAESLLAQQQTREQTASTHGLDDPSHDDMRAALLAPDGIKAGLEVFTPEALRQKENAAWEESERGQRIAAIAAAATEREEADARELYARRRADVVEGAAFTFATSGDSDEIASAWMQLTPQERAQLVENGDVDASDVPWLDAQAAQARDVISTAAHGLAEANRNWQATFGRQARWDALVAENGWNEAQATAVLTEANAVALSSGLGGLANLAPEDWDATVRGVAHAREAAVQAHQDARMKAEVFFAPDTNVSSGLEVLGPDGRWARTQPAPQIVARPDLSGVEAAMDGRVGRGPSDDDIKRAVGDDDQMTREYREVQAKAAALFGEK